MNRLQKKCFIASAGLHSLLVIILIIGPAFLSSKSKVDDVTKSIDIIPDTAIPADFYGGGNPNTRPPPPAPPSLPPPSTPQRTVAPPEPIPAPKPEPVKTREPEPVKPKVVTESLELKKEKEKKPKLEITTKPVSRSADSQKKPKQPSEADERAKELANAQAKEAARRKELASLIGSSARSLHKDFSPATTININPGPGGGGEAYAGYDMILQKIYQGRYDEALGVASDIADARASVKVSVTILRDGTVLNSKIVDPSGIPNLDRLVRGVLGRVNTVRPFPESSKDSQRTFEILFELKPKRGIG